LYCNSRKKGTKTPKIDVSETWGGEGYCKSIAGRGTNHAGQGRCKNHGGATPIKKGIYSKIEREEISQLIEHFENLEDPLDLAPEVAMARAFLTKFVNKYEDIVDALLDWHFLYELEGKEPKGRPPVLPSQQRIIMLLDTISKIVKRIQEIKSDHTITRKDLFRILGEMGRVVESEVEPEQWKKIKNVWLSIKLA